MKGDFSRLTFDKRKHYSAVLKQQGRVDVDADWNEMQAIQRHRMETGAADVIGCCGAPARNPGFHIVTQKIDLSAAEQNLPGNNPLPKVTGGDFIISAGRIYVDGILCENEKAILYSKQTDLPLPPKVTSGQAIVYLDVWQRHITALDDEAIRESALGGPDTATRLKTIWQVKVLPFSIAAFNPAAFVRQISSLDKTLKLIASNIDPEVTLQASNIKKSAGKLMKAKVAIAEWNPTVAEANAFLDNLINLRLPRETDKSLIQEMVAPIQATLPPVKAISCKNPPPEWGQLIAPNSGKLSAHTQPAPPTADPCCTVPPGAGYRGLENQLYRVEIHQGNVQPDGTPAKDKTGNPITPTFKWSRDNGSVVTAITGINGQTISVHDLGPDNVLGFAIGQWVEVIDDTRELNGQPGDLLKITDIQTGNQIVVSPQPTLPFNSIYHPKLRRWDTMGDAGDIAIKAGTWQALENGIEVQLTDGTYKIGDYWLIPARTGTGDIEWPRQGDPQGNPDPNKPVAQSPRGIEHHFCRLALVARSARGWEVTEDCRCVFPPLCKLDTSPAFHVTKISWPNDGWLNVLDLAKNGLRITFDAPPDQNALNGGSFIVTLESFKTSAGSAVGDGLREALVLEGKASLDSANPTLVVWKPTSGKLPGFQDVRRGQEPRVRVRLLGQKLWSQVGDQTLYLDGQVFGQAGSHTDGSQRTALKWPSGNGARASDFESWFYLGTPPSPAPAPPVVPTPPQPMPISGMIPEQLGHKEASPAPKRKRRSRASS